MTRTVEYDFAPHSPWTCLGHLRFRGIARQRRTRIDVLPVEAGVFGAPSCVIDGEIFRGQDRLDFVDRRLA